MVTWRLPFQLLLHRCVGEDGTPFSGFLHFTLDHFLIILSVKQICIKYHALSLWYDLTSDWNQLSRIIGEHSTQSVARLDTYLSKVGYRIRVRLEGSLFNSYNTEEWGRALRLSLEFSTLPLIRTLYCWVLSKVVWSTILKSLVWRNLGLNPDLPDHWWTVNSYC